jgi:RND family efflux transporter MFP subunit
MNQEAKIKVGSTVPGRTARRLFWVLSASLVISGCAEKQEPPIGKSSAESHVNVIKVTSRRLDREMVLPGEILAFQDVPIYPKVPGFIEWIGIDRGSIVKKGQLLIKIIAPELESEVEHAQANVKAADAAWKEAQSKLASSQEQRLKALARYQADRDTYERMRDAAKTPGVVAGNDVEIAEKVSEADLAQVRSAEQTIRAAEALVRSEEEKVKAARKQEKTRGDIRAYLTVTAPFDGIITERNTHTGSFVGPPAGPIPMVRIRELSLLRLVIPVPEIAVGGVKDGDKIYFTVPAYPGRRFSGFIRRIGHYLDEKTRTMPVELNVHNPDWLLSPGMFPDVFWPSTRNQPTLFVPSTAVAATTERTFVCRVRDGIVDWVDVKRGQPMGNLVEVFGDLREGDEVAVRGTDELKPEQHVCVSVQKAEESAPPAEHGARYSRSYE